MLCKMNLVKGLYFVVKAKCLCLHRIVLAIDCNDDALPSDSYLALLKMSQVFGGLIETLIEVDAYVASFASPFTISIQIQNKERNLTFWN